MRPSPSSTPSVWPRPAGGGVRPAIGAAQLGMEERLMLQVLLALDEDGERMSYLLSGDRLDVLYRSAPKGSRLDVMQHRLDWGSLAAHVDRQTLAALESHHLAALSEGQSVLRFQLQDPVALGHWFEESLRRVPNLGEGPALLFGQMREVTQQVMHEQRVQEVMSRLQLRDRALASTHAAIAILDLDPSQAGLTYTNAAFDELLARMQVQRLGSLRDLPVHPTAARTLQQLHDSATSGLEERRTLRLRDVGGMAVWVSLTVSPVKERGSARHVVLALEDVSARLESELRFKTVVESVREVVFQTDASGRWTYLNPAWEEASGHSVASCLGQTLLERVDPQDQLLVHAAWTALSEGQAQEHQSELRLCRAGGGVSWVEWHVRSVRDETGRFTGTVGTMTDINGRIEALKAQRLQQQAIEASSNGIVIVDARTQTIRHANAGFERLSGRPVQEWLGQPYLDWIDPGLNDAQCLGPLRQALAEVRPLRVTLQGLRAGRSYFCELDLSPVQDPVSGEWNHWVAVHTDVTARVEYERSSEEQLRRFAATLSMSPDGYVLVDVKGHVSAVNPALLGWLELEEQEVLGQPEAALLDALLARCDAAAGPPIASAWRGEASPGSQAVGACSVVLHSPKRRTLSMIVRSVEDPAIRRLVYFRDVSAEAEMAQMKSDFLSTAAHELRSPMASIRGFAELLTMRKFDPERSAEILGTIHRQTVRLSHLINELLDLARIESRQGSDFHYQELALTQLVQDTVQALMIPGETRRPVLELPQASPWVRADADKLSQVLINVLSNAFKYSPGGGDVTLRLVSQERSQQRYVGVQVQDRGIGMTAEQLTHCFEKFFRANPSGDIPGTGLGLALVKEIVEIHGGWVDLQSEHGQGSTLTVWLPEITESPALA